MKSTKKNKEKNKILIIITAVVMVIAIIGGATFAYWSWQSNTAQKTNVNVTVAGGSLTIDGGVVEGKKNTQLYPTVNCYYGLRSSTATVTATNQTASPMTVNLYIKVRLTSHHGQLSTDTKKYLRWAIDQARYDENDNPYDTFASGCNHMSYQGTFESVGSTPTDIYTGITFEVPANNVVEKEYEIAVWLDEEYEFVNSGDNVTDPMQDLEILVQWSEASTMTQQPQ